MAEGGVEAALRQRLLERMGGLRVGDPRAPPTQVGPQPPPPIGGPPPEEVVQAAKEEGAQVRGAGGGYRVGGWLWGFWGGLMGFGGGYGVGGLLGF